MALVTAGFELSVTVVDQGNTPSVLTYDLRGADAATAATQTATVLAALDPRTKSAIAGYRLTEVFVEDALTLPTDGANNAEKASVSVLLSGAGKKLANVKIPAPADSLFAAATGRGYNTVLESAITPYLDLYKVTGGVANLSDGEQASDTNTFDGGSRTSTTRNKSS